MSSRFTIGPCFAALLAGSLLAQEPPPPLSSAFFAGRRAALLQRWQAELQPGETHVLMLRGAAARGDMDTFYQDHDFYYLTGVSEPDLALILLPDGKEELLVPPFSRFTATWEGQRLAPGDAAAQRTGFAKVGNSQGLLRRLKELLDAAPGKRVIWTALEPQPNKTSTPGAAVRGVEAMNADRFDGRQSREQRLKEDLERLFPGVEVRDICSLIGELRAIKTPEEIAQIRAASEIAAQGQAEAIKSTRPGVYEYQIAAAARYVFTRLGAGPDAYAAIVGAGPNGCILHYSANSRRVENGDLIVMDYGPTVNGYCTDVTRTYPANGKFTPEQRKLVQDIYEIQQALIERVRPGVRMKDLGDLCTQMLRDKGYRSDHGPSHHVGLAVHDKQGEELAPGMIITVEPGAYLRDDGMGCRIEDVVLVTQDGHEVLSSHLPSSPDDVERLMQSGGGIQQQVVGLPHEAAQKN
jgi:Xaa-Pro aminopeptidase